MTNTNTNSDSPPRDRHVVVRLTDDEWRQVRIAAAQRDSTIQGWMTDVVLTELQRDD